MIDASALSPAMLYLILGIAAAVIVFAGSKLAYTADSLADRTGLGEALAGAMLLGAATSLPGTIASATTAWNGFPSLAYSNALGGIAAQTLFLVVADFVYRRANLEHAAVSLANIINAVTLVTLLALMQAASYTPEVTVFGVHPVSLIILVAYGFGLKFAQTAQAEPMWVPTDTSETRHDEPDAKNEKKSLVSLWVSFAAALLVVAIAGYVVAQCAGALVTDIGLPQSVVGAFITAIITSLPELVTTIAAVRVGALQLAVGGIIGGNAFDTLFASMADMAYREGSLFHALGPNDHLLTASVILMTGILLLGLIKRERVGIAGVGVEGFLIPSIYAITAAIVIGTSFT